MSARDLSAESDAALVACFAAGRDERVFAEVVRRHGPMVMGVARRILRNADDAEDAFQATFLALATAADRVKRHATVAGWLHQTAVRTAKALRRKNMDWRRKIERKGEQVSRTGSSRRCDLAATLDDKLQSLPAKFRSAVVLCDLEGLTRKEAAERLDLPIRTVSSQVARGRQLLRERLVRHGISLSVGGLAAHLTGFAEASPSVSPRLVLETTNQAVLYTAGKTAAEIGISQAIVHAAHGAIRPMTIMKFAAVAAAALALVVISTASVGGLPGILGSVAMGRTVIFYDDFNDGDATDGMPGTWLPGAEPGGTRDASSGDFEVSHTELMSTLVQELEGLRNVSIRAQLRFTQLSTYPKTVGDWLNFAQSSEQIVPVPLS